MIVDQKVFIVECQDGAGIDYVIADDIADVKRIVKQVLAQKENNQVCDILEVQVLKKYRHEFNIVEAVPENTMEWKNLPTNPIDVDIARMTTYLSKEIYPTTQIMTGDITPEEYVQSIAAFLVEVNDTAVQKEELIDRRIDPKNLPFFLQLGGLLKDKSDPYCYDNRCSLQGPHRQSECTP